MIKTSSDGITWTSRSSGTMYLLPGVTYGNGIFIAVGTHVTTSQDGINWTARYFSGVNNPRGIAYGNGLFVVVGETGKILTSPDGINWTTRHRYNKYLEWHRLWQWFFVIGDETRGHILTSPNGINWTPVSRIVISW